MASVLPVQFTIGLAAGLPQWDMFLMFTTCGVMGALVTHYANAAGPVLFGANYVSVKLGGLLDFSTPYFPTLYSPLLVSRGGQC